MTHSASSARDGSNTRSQADPGPFLHNGAEPCSVGGCMSTWLPALTGGQPPANAAPLSATECRQSTGRSAAVSEGRLARGAPGRAHTAAAQGEEGYTPEPAGLAPLPAGLSPKPAPAWWLPAGTLQTWELGPLVPVRAFVTYLLWPGTEGERGERERAPQLAHLGGPPCLSLVLTALLEAVCPRHPSGSRLIGT